MDDLRFCLTHFNKQEATFQQLKKVRKLLEALLRCKTNKSHVPAINLSTFLRNWRSVRPTYIHVAPKQMQNFSVPCFLEPASEAVDGLTGTGQGRVASTPQSSRYSQWSIHIKYCNSFVFLLLLVSVHHCTYSDRPQEICDPARASQ